MLDASIIDAVYEAAVVPDLWPSLLDRVAGRLDARGGILFTATPREVVRWTSSKSLRQFCEGFISEGWTTRNPRATRALALNEPRFIQDLDLFTLDEVRSEPVYEFFRREGGGWCIGTVIQPPGGEAVILNWERPHKAGPFAAATTAALDPFRSDFARAGLIAARLQLERFQAAAAILDVLGIPAAVLSTTFRVTATNALFSDYVPEVVQDTRDGIRLTNPRADALLWTALTALRGRAPGAISSIPVAGTAKHGPAVVHLVPIRGVANDVFWDASALVVITSVAARTAPAPVELLQGLFDLTVAEARVARAIADGQTLADLAQASGVAISTIRTQLNAVFGKTGVSRQAELAKLLAHARPLSGS